LTGAVCTLGGTGRGAETEAATGAEGAGETEWERGASVFRYGERVSSLGGRRAICIVRDCCPFLGTFGIDIAGGTGIGSLKGGVLLDAVCGWGSTPAR
jgi:hypothetical protein